MPPKTSSASIRRFFRRSRITVLILGIAGIVLIAIGLASWLWVPSVRSYSVKISGSVPTLDRHKVAEYLKRHADEVNLDVEIIPNQGTLDSLRMVENRELDLAVVSGLVRIPHRSSIREVAQVTVEQLHVLVKSEHAQAVSKDYQELKRLTVNVGPKGKETAMVAENLLSFLRLKPASADAKEGVRTTDVSFAELFARVKEMEKAEPAEAIELRKKIPDVVIYLSVTPSPLARQLVEVGRYQLLPLPFAEAFSHISVEEEDLDRDHINQVHVTPSVIPAFSYGISPAVPAQDLPTLGAPMILIAHKDVPDEVIKRLMPRIFSGSVQRLYQPPPLENLVSTYPLHSASIRWRDRDKPLVRADVTDLLQQSAGVIGPLIGGGIALYGFYRWRQLLAFMAHFRELQRLDLVVKGLIQDENVPTGNEERLRYMEAQLERLQRRAVDDYCRTYFYREGVFENFLNLLSESRDYLRRSGTPLVSEDNGPSGGVSSEV